MKFTKNYLKDILYTDAVVHDEIIDNSRWSIEHEMVFKHEDSFYMTYYSVGATEQQDEAPFEYADDEIECIEVEEKPVTVMKWVEVQR